MNTTEKDLFAFKINYNTTENCTNYTGTALYNGNISETYWRSASDNVERKYGYKYDNLNRLRESIYQKPGLTIAQTLVTNAYDENIAYDKNGNITSLNRKGNGDPQIGAMAIDDLTYIYMSNSSNQLLKVTDSPNGNDAQGFIDANKTDDYTYDANGNMTLDRNKGITTPIIYNHLNLPTKIPYGISNISYVYNATGIKLSKTVVAPVQGSLIYYTRTTTYYLGGFQYTTSSQFSPNAKRAPSAPGLSGPQLQFFPTAEGYVDCSTGIFNYIYNYTDHLGNVRLSYRDINKDGTITNDEILEESNYYPFGLKHSGYNSNNLQAGYKYKYNGKELQDELGLNMYDYGARNYDPALGRWMNIDPLADVHPNMTPYRYCFNNPINVTDPTGMLEDWYTDNNDVMQFDPNVQSQKDLGNKGTYVGDTDKQTTASGGTADFRKDGSILYSNEKDAYQRIWTNTFARQREQFAVMGDKNVLVLPDYNGKIDTSSNIGEYGYSFKNGNLQDPVTGKSFNTVATAHTHPDGGGPSFYTMSGSFGDLGFATRNTPNKPAFVLQNNANKDISFIIGESGSTNDKNKAYTGYPVTKNNPNINVNSIRVNTSLIQYAKTIKFP